MQISALSRSVFFQFQQTAQLWLYLEMKSLTSSCIGNLVGQLVQHSLCGAAFKVIQKLQVGFEEALKYDISPNLACLHGLSMCFCAKFMVLILTYKAFNSLGPCWSISLKDLLSAPPILSGLKVATLMKAQKSGTKSLAYNIAPPIT